VIHNPDDTTPKPWQCFKRQHQKAPQGERQWKEGPLKKVYQNGWDKGGHFERVEKGRDRLVD
jgi:hypothetical protein